MSYQDELHRLKSEKRNFDSIRNLSFKRCPYISTEEDKALYDSIERGQKILETEEQVDKYMQAFGKKHYVKFVTLFDKIPMNILNETFDLVDWGCGQGLGIIALADFCRKIPGRDIESKVRQITLIEPSRIALSRAIINARACFPESTVLPVHKKFEELSDSDFSGVATLPRIHIFSNVLDMDCFRDRDLLLKFADKVKKGAFGFDEYFICVSPTHNKVIATINQFIRHIAHPDHFDVYPILEPVEQIFTKESDGADVKMTARVDRIRNKRVLNLMKSINNKGLLDEMNLRRDSTNGQRSLVELVAKQCDDTNHFVLFRPNLMGDTPDMIILKPEHKALVIQVCDLRENVIKVADYVESIKHNLYGLHAQHLMAQKLHDRRAYGAVRTVLFFPNIRSEDIAEIRQVLTDADAQKYQYVTCLCPESHILFSYSNFMDADVYGELVNLLRPAASRHNTCNISLDKYQREMAVSEYFCKKKISGVVGSGKTTVLVARAISAFKRTHKQVLILTYNITLRNYIEHIIFSQFGPFTRNQFYVVNFHEFLSAEIRFAIATNGLNSSFKQIGYEDENSLVKFEQEKDKFRKYNSIFIDEVQDYLHIWLKVICNIFGTDDGEYVLFGDEKQNIYRRSLDEKKIRTNVPGVFSRLKSSHRSNEDILRCVALFQKNIMSKKYDVDEEMSDPEFYLISRSGFIRYEAIGRRDARKVIDLITKCIHERQAIPYSEITVVGCSIPFLQECEKEYKEQTNLRTERMFESQDEVQLVSDEFELKALQRSKKLHFNGFADVIKFSTVHSYKGWESDTIVELVEPNEHDDESDTDCELIYTGFTRAKRNLFVINCGNTTYEKELCDIFDHRD
jgi:hypothetical protein